MKDLNAKALLALVVLAVGLGLLVFIPAWTVHYWQAWVYLSIFMGASLITTLDLMKRDRALLERRMSAGPTAEKRPAQKRALGILSGYRGVDLYFADQRRDFEHFESSTPGRAHLLRHKQQIQENL